MTTIIAQVKHPNRDFRCDFPNLPWEIAAFFIHTPPSTGHHLSMKLKLLEYN